MSIKRMIIRAALGGLVAGALIGALMGVPSWATPYYGPGMSLAIALYAAPVGMTVGLVGLLTYGGLQQVLKNRRYAIVAAALVCGAALLAYWSFYLAAGSITSTTWILPSITTVAAIPLGHWVTRAAKPKIVAQT